MVLCVDFDEKLCLGCIDDCCYIIDDEVEDGCIYWFGFGEMFCCFLDDQDGCDDDQYVFDDC